jgi:hypothetical protein
MANIFRKKDAYIDRVNRSTFDLSFVNNLTMKFGAITPVCLLPLIQSHGRSLNLAIVLSILLLVCLLSPCLLFRSAHTRPITMHLAVISVITPLLWMVNRNTISMCRLRKVVLILTSISCIMPIGNLTLILLPVQPAHH